VSQEGDTKGTRNEKESRSGEARGRIDKEEGGRKEGR
jgi:hypothetical protein